MATSFRLGCSRPDRTVLRAVPVLLSIGAYALGAVACREPAADDPVAAVEGLLGALEEGRSKVAWRYLLADDRAELLARHRALAEARGEQAEATPAAALATLGIEVLRTPENATLASRPGQTVEVRVNVEGGESATFEVHKEDGAWRVALLEALTSTASPGGG